MEALRKSKWIIGFLIGAVALCIVAISSRPDGKLHVTFYGVGEGDSIFIKTPKGQSVLIDGGPNDRVVDFLGKDMPFYDRTLDLIVISHVHADHISGFLEVLKRYQVKKILLNQCNYQSPEYENLRALIAKENIPVEEISMGETIDFGSNIAVQVLWPSKEEVARCHKEIVEQNDESLVLRLGYGGFCALFTGDAPAQVQKMILSQRNVEHCSLLKVPHHGAKDAYRFHLCKKLCRNWRLFR